MKNPLCGRGRAGQAEIARPQVTGSADADGLPVCHGVIRGSSDSIYLTRRQVQALTTCRKRGRSPWTSLNSRLRLIAAPVHWACNRFLAAPR